MIQFNLLPDIKLEYIKAKRAKRTVVVVSSIVSGVALGAFVLLFITVNVFQKNHIEDLGTDINSQVAELEKTPDLDKILTIQSQLNSLTPLHEHKPVVSRLFTYLPDLVPQQVTISQLNLNLTDSTMKISGSADDLVTINKFVDTLKFTQFSDNGAEVNAFTNVVLTDFGRTPNEVNYSISYSFNPYIFDSSKEVKLTVPKIISTRSETEKPSENLFKDQESVQTNQETTQ